MRNIDFNNDVMPVLLGLLIGFVVILFGGPAWAAYGFAMLYFLGNLILTRR